MTVPIPEWDGQEAPSMLEEDASFEDGRVEYIDGRQTELRVVR